MYHNWALHKLIGWLIGLISNPFHFIYILLAYCVVINSRQQKKLMVFYGTNWKEKPNNQSIKYETSFVINYTTALKNRIFFLSKSKNLYRIEIFHFCGKIKR